MTDSEQYNKAAQGLRAAISALLEVEPYGSQTLRDLRAIEADVLCKASAAGERETRAFLANCAYEVRA